MNQSCPDEKREVAARLNLWLVDDNEEFRRGFDLLLTRHFGFQRIRHFDSAEAAIEALGGGSGPDAVLLDVKLPGMSGVSAVSMIKARSPATRIFMLATFRDLGCASRSLEAGATAFFTKHELYEDIVSAVCAAPIAGLQPRQLKTA